MATVAAAPSSTTIRAYGCDLVVSLAPDKTEFTLGEPVFLTFAIATTCDKKFGVIDGGDYRNDTGRADTFKMTAVTSTGQIVPTLEGGPNFGGLSSARPITREKPFEKRLLIGHWIDLPAPGKYTLTVTKELLVGATLTPDGADKTAFPVTVATNVTVTPRSNEKLGAIIQSLGQRLSASDDGANEAMIALRSLQDERVIPYFVKLVDGPDVSKRFSALWGLQRYGTDEALASIMKTATIPDMRLTAAQVLAENPHPKAWDALWAMHADTDENVRLTVLHALAKRKSPDTQLRLEAFTKDRSKMVSDEAKRYLRERSATP